MQDRYDADAAGQFAAAIAYYGFLSLFPLVLLVLSLAGFVLAGDPAAQADVFELLTSALPGLEAQLDDTLAAVVEARATTGVVGVLLLLFSGLRVVDSATVATSRIFRVDVTAMGGLKRRLRELGALALLGTLALAGAAAGSLVGVRTGGVTQVVVSVGATVLSLGIDFVLFLVAYRLLTAAAGPGWRDLWPGALLGAVGWTALKVAGSTLVASQVAGARQVYGGLASAIGILFLLFLAARLYLYGAEWNAVRHDAAADAGDGRTDAAAGPAA